MIRWIVLWCLVSQLAADAADYLRDIKPILRDRCYACHGALKQEAGLRLDTAASVRHGSDGGAVINPEQPSLSALLTRVTSLELSARMPPEGEPLTAQQIEHLQEWIRSGASGPEDERPDEDPRQHWAFRSLVRPRVPELQDAAWCRNPIDAFVSEQHARRGWTPQPPAEPAVLLRRMHLDVTGLPPTREQLQQFLTDDSPGAADAVVDQLLAAPQYGERWGRHWMDVWRYSDWYGRRMVPDVWNSAPQIWRWRDWIVRSLNADKGYDRMVAEMLAADEIDPENDEAGYATGYLIRNWYALNPNDWMRSNVEHTGKAFLGLTFNCAHCHDHKYDPISQEDYFRFRAFFEPIGIRQDRVPGEPDPGPFQEYSYSVLRKIVRTGSVRVYDKSPEATTWFYTGGDERNRVAERGRVAPGTPGFLTPTALPIEPVSLPAHAWYPGLRPALQEAILQEQRVLLQTAEDELAEVRTAAAAVPPDRPDQQAAAGDTLTAGSVHPQRTVTDLKLRALELRKQALVREQASLIARFRADQAKYGEPPHEDALNLAREASLAERQAAVAGAESQVAAQEHLLAMAQARPADTKGRDQEVTAAEKGLKDARAALTAAQAKLSDPSAADAYSGFSPVYPATSTGRRRALASWIISPQNPLTARVAVNHLWMRHFHAPLVPTVSDFGRNGKPPSHPELLDWLAVELMESGWSMKHIHRLILNSQTWRMSSAAAADNDPRHRADPENGLLWRMNIGRMEAEVVRDSLLSCGGLLDLTMGGQELENSEALTTFRRSLYYSCHPELDGKSVFGALFDAAEASECYRRTRSVIPQQALALTNSDLIQQVSAAVVQSMKAPDRNPDNADGREFVTEAFERVLCRAPTAAEMSVCLGFLETGGEDSATAGTTPADADQILRSREGLVRVLLNHNDFVAIR